VSSVKTLFFDIGGVCLTNGWDHISREKSTKYFSLDYEELERKHKKIFKQFEKGKITLDKYLDEILFYEKREFTKQDYIDFMYSQSKALDSTLKLLSKLKARQEYKIASINNESLELNRYRIMKYNLDKYFDCFFSSCYLGTRKPEPDIFYKALKILHNEPDECLFLDDREENYRSALTVGMNAILIYDIKELEHKLIEKIISI